MKYIVLFFIILISSVAVAQANEVFVLYLNVHNDDAVDLKDFKIISGSQNVYADQAGNYPIKIISFDDEVLFESKLQIGFVTYRETRDEDGNMKGEEVVLESAEQFIRLPYFKNAKTIELYHEDKLIYTLDVSEHLCKKNSVCEGYENELNCPGDCANKDANKCDGKSDAVCDADCAPGEDPDCIKCGNDICDKDESCSSCPKDCGECDAGPTCGDGKCDTGESYKTCKADCPKGSDDGYCDGVKDGICDTDCASGKDADCISGKSYLVYYLVGFLLIAILLFIGYRKGEKRDKWDELEKKYS
ncbi:MAG: hypothetical protein ABIG84_07380 [archaeon]